MDIKLKLSQAELRKCTGVAELAQAVMDHFHLAKDAGNLLYVYHNGVYKPNGKEWVWRVVQQLLELGGNAERWSTHKCEQVAAYITTKVQRLWEVPLPYIINVGNGLLDVNTPALRLHDPAFLSSVQIPVFYNPQATCPAIDRFLQQVLPPEIREIAYEITAYLLVPRPGIQKAILLYGGGANGKSTFLDILVTLLGENNVSSISLQELESDRFAAAGLVGKLANIAADLPNEKVKAISRFKTITGGDLLSVERKHQQRFAARIFAKLIFSSNFLPFSDDQSYGYSRRWITVPFPNRFPDDGEKKRQLTAELTSAPELSGLLNKALAVLPRLLARGFSESQSIKKVMQELQAGGKLGRWLNEWTVQSPEAFVIKKALWEAFNEDTGTNITQQAFGRALKSLCPGVEDAQRRVKGEQVWVYVGLEFTTPRVSRV